MAAGPKVDERRQERHMELVNSQSNLRGAINRLQDMTDRVKYGDEHPPSETAEETKEIDLGSLAMVLSNLPQTMEVFVKDIDAIRAQLENALF